MSKAFCSFPQFLYVNAGIVTQIGPQLLPAKFFAIQFSLIILSFDITADATVKWAMNKYADMHPCRCANTEEHVCVRVRTHTHTKRVCNNLSFKDPGMNFLWISKGLWRWLVQYMNILLKFSSVGIFTIHDISGVGYTPVFRVTFFFCWRLGSNTGPFNTRSLC